MLFIIEMKIYLNGSVLVFNDVNIKIETNISSGGLDSSAVERQPFKLVVEGSIPSWGASFCEMG